MRTAIGVLCVAACAAAVRVGPPAPATSFVYRSDRGGPASLLRLGHDRPAPAFEAYDPAPVPLPYVNAKPIAFEDAEGDEEDGDDGYDEGGEGGRLAHGHESGGGSEFGEEHHDAHGGKGSEGYASEGHYRKGKGGDYGGGDDRAFYHENGGEKDARHDEAEAHGAHHAAGKHYKGGDRGHEKHFSKGEDVTGYHKVFDKNEYKKDHDFYDEAAKDGHFERHGYRKAHHGSEKGAHEKGGRGEVGYDKGGFGKSGFHKNGHVDEEDEGHSAEGGLESHHHHQEGYGKEGGSGHRKEFGFADDGDEHDE